MSSLANVSNSLSARATELLAQLAQRQKSSSKWIQPVAIVGPGEARPEQCLAAYQVAYCLAGAGITLVCGGRGGVMEAASRAAQDAGGLVIGLLPEDDISSANAYLGIAIPTGMGEMRNALIARASICMIAIGGGMGTLSEVALGLKWNKPVFSLYEEVVLPNLRRCEHVDQLLEEVLAWLVETNRNLSS
jgi:uncharacterized protein (TIGR00725 family)